MGTMRTHLAALVLAVAASSAAQATILEKIEFDKLCQDAERIVVATCNGQSSSWDTDHKTIYTKFGFTVDEVVKGESSATVDIWSLGGIVGTEGMSVAGAPNFRPGEQYVLFLEKGGDDRWRCKGWTQGRYEVATDPATKQKTVRGDTSGAGLATKGKTGVEEGERGKPMGLSTFLEAVRSKSGGSNK